MGKKAAGIGGLLGLGAIAVIGYIILSKNNSPTPSGNPTITADKTAINAGDSVTFTLSGYQPRTTYTIQNVGETCFLNATPCTVPSPIGFVHETAGTVTTDASGHGILTSTINIGGAFYASPRTTPNINWPYVIVAVA